MATSDNMKDIFEQFLNVYRNRTKENYFQFLSETISGFGTGPDEIFFDKDEWQALFNREVEKNLGPTEIEIHRSTYIPIIQGAFLALIVFTRKTEITYGSVTFNKCRFSGVFRQSDDKWSLIHSHLSIPLYLQQEGESFPIQELERKNRDLEALVGKKTTELQKSNESLKKKNLELENALNEVHTLKTLLPICSYCKKIRNSTGNWENIDEYLRKNSDIQLSHGMCQECLAKFYPHIDL